MNFQNVDFNNSTETELFIRTSFASSPSRLLHILEISRRVRNSCDLLNSRHKELHLDPDLAYRAALLHDVGYLSEVQKTGFHPFDGAEMLRARGYDQLAHLIEGHSSSPEEAEICGYPSVQQSEELIAKLITYWDVQVKQGGDVVSYVERYREIIERYGPESPIGRANSKARSRIEILLAEISSLLGKAEKNNVKR